MASVLVDLTKYKRSRHVYKQTILYHLWRTLSQEMGSFTEEVKKFLSRNDIGTKPGRHLKFAKGDGRKVGNFPPPSRDEYPPKMPSQTNIILNCSLAQYFTHNLFNIFGTRRMELQELYDSEFCSE